RSLPIHEFRPRLGCRRDWRRPHRGVRHAALSDSQPLGGRLQVSIVGALPAARARAFFELLAPGGQRALFVLSVIAICLLFAFPVFWLVLTSLRPGYAVYYLHPGTDFTLDH